MLISIVVPVFNSLVLPELVERIDAVFAALPEDYEIVFVDDASPDPAVWTTLEQLTRERSNIKVIQLTRNFGSQPATLCGLAYARGDFVFTMDDDLQHRPEDIPGFLARRNADIVIAQFAAKQHSLFKRLASRAKGVFDRLILDKPRHIQLSPFRMLSRTVVDGVLSMRSPHPFIPALMFHVSKNVVGVEATHDPRKRGRTGYTLGKQIRLFSNLLINNSSLVLRLVGYVGITFSLISVSYAGYVVFVRLVYGTGVKGWSSLFAALLLIGGLLLFSVGVVGEYLIRIIETSESRPTYFVRRVLVPPAARGASPPADPHVVE
jgi:dolichol-phosphate mannosyltransferase/undecaprenyl-phosphate 4-deoxy-4-formamido-L-arabinose transferase